MSLVYKLNGSTLATSRVFFNFAGAEDWEMSEDATGPSGGQGTVVIQDPLGDLTVRTWMPFTAEESASSQPRLVTAWITKVTERRGSYLTGVGREFVCELADANVLLGLRLIESADGNRPTETDDARLAWLIGSDCLDGIVFDTGYINGNGTTFDATDYRWKTAQDVLADLSRGRIYFAFWDPVASEVGLFFDLPDTTVWTSTISVSNVATDVNSTTVFALSDDATWERDGEGVFSTIHYEYLGAALTVHSATTASTFFPSPLLDRGETVETPNVGKTATATVQANLLLTQASDEAKTLKGRIWLPKEEAGLFLAGQRSSFRASHFTGLTSATYLHLNKVTYKPWADHPGYYEVNFEASNFGITGTTGGPSGPPVPPVPPQPPGTAVHFYSDTFNIIGDETWVPNSPFGLISGLQTCATTTTTLVADTVYNYDMLLTMQFGSASTGLVEVVNDDLSSTLSIPLAKANNTGSGPDFSNDAGVYHFTGSFTAPDAAHIKNPYRMRGETGQFPHGNDVKGSLTFWIDPVGWDDGTTVSVPVAGSPILGEVVATGDGSTTSFTTDWTFVAGSLKLYVDLLDQTTGLVASDGEAKTFTLGFAPQLGEQITVDYIKAP